VKQPEQPKLLQIMEPGLITGVSDDDPGGITLPVPLHVLGPVATIVMAITVVAMVATWLG